MIRFYETEGERFLHVVGFAELQPAGRNGKRVRKVPPSPWDGGELDGTQSSGDAGIADRPDIASAPLGGLGESGGIRVNPSESGCDVRPHSHKHSHTHSQIKPAPAAPAPSSGEVAAGGPSPAADAQAPPAPPEAVLTFECVGGRKSAAKSWPLTPAFVAELAEQFPAVDILSKARKALGWTQLKPANRKTADGMRKFLWTWMSREQNRGGARTPARPKADRQQALLAALEAS